MPQWLTDLAEYEIFSDLETNYQNAKSKFEALPHQFTRYHPNALYILVAAEYWNQKIYFPPFIIKKVSKLDLVKAETALRKRTELPAYYQGSPREIITLIGKIHKYETSLIETAVWKFQDLLKHPFSFGKNPILLAETIILFYASFEGYELQNCIYTKRTLVNTLEKLLNQEILRYSDIPSQVKNEVPNIRPVHFEGSPASHTST